MKLNGARLRTIRVGAGFGLRDLASLAEVSPSYLSMIENNERNPSPKIMMRLAEALGMTMAELIQRTRWEPPSKAP